MTLLAAVERPHTSPSAPDCAPLPWPALYSGPAGPALCRRLSPGRLLTAPPRLLLSALSLPASLYRRLGKISRPELSCEIIIRGHACYFSCLVLADA